MPDPKSPITEPKNMIIRLSKKLLASDFLFFQIIGASLKRWWLMLILAIVAFSPLYSCYISPRNYICAENQWYQFFVLLLVVWLSISVCNTLTDVFSLRKKEAGITWCQIAILLAIGCLIVGFLFIFDITDKSVNTAAFGIVASLVAWIFQDAIRGVVSFIHLRMNHLLQIDDMIKVPKYDVYGKVTRVTLTTVTIYNLDTTTSAIPTSVLLSEHFTNMQKMIEGKTFGRKMSLSFIMETGSFYALSKKDVIKFRANERITQYIPQENIHDDIPNAQLYRKYLFHWLMNNQHVSQHPLLVVSWQKHTEAGMILQITGFIIDNNISAFEYQKSLIIEHVIQSVSWFGLRLYQTPSSFDSSSSTVYLSDKPLNDKLED